MRLFVAVDIPVELKAALDEEVVEPLRPALPGARWTRPEGRHITLKFLGPVAAERLGEIGDGLRGAALRHAPFAAAFGELGGFPAPKRGGFPRRPRVVWVGLSLGHEQMAPLAADVDESLTGFPREERPFTGHLTLARFKVPQAVADVPTVEVPSEPFTVNEITLFRSELRRDGAVYTALERFPLSR